MYIMVTSIPKFVKHFGLDFIITDDPQIYLIELQHRFGRLGLQILYPRAWQIHRKQYRILVRDAGPCRQLLSGIRKICRNKIETYRLFREYQPESFIFNGWRSARLRKWVDSLTSDYILSKPPLGTCGQGILLFERERFLEDGPKRIIGGPVLLQEYIFSKRYQTRGLETDYSVGCIRHVCMMRCDGKGLKLLHLPSYWRVAPLPFTRRISEDTLVANISRGAFPVEVAPEDMQLIHDTTNRIACELVTKIFGARAVPLDQVSRMDPEGAIHGA